MIKKRQQEIMKDIRQQVKWIQQAINDGDDQSFISQLSFQLSATVLQLDDDQ